ncbi:hypothetical protein ACFLT8_03285, partial [Chloroflexota bacterium]
VAEIVEAEVKVVVFWKSVVAYLPSPLVIGSITYDATGANGGSGGGGGGGGVPPTKVEISGLSSVTSLRVDESGVAIENCQLRRLDEKAWLDIPKETKLVTVRGNALGLLTASEVTATRDVSAGIFIVSAVDFGPDGAKFEPAITLTMSYDPVSLPDGTTEDELYITCWDGSQWLALPSMVDTGANTVSAKISHFTQFALLGKLPPEQNSIPPLAPHAAEPARFAVSTLSIVPGKVEPAQVLTVSVVVTNIGGSRGEYTIVLKINGSEESRRRLMFDPDLGLEVGFSIAENLTGTYEVDVNGLVGSFVVKEAVIKPVSVLPEVPLLERISKLNWWLISGIIAAVAVISIVVWWVTLRRRAF